MFAQKNGHAVAVAYEGDADFRRDGKNGSVAVEIPLFYTPPRFPGDGYEYWGVSGTCHAGWQVNPAFQAADGSLSSHVYIAAYEISQSHDGALTSCSGAYPLVGQTLEKCRAGARASGAQLFDLSLHSLLQDLFITEFATTDSHGIMTGSCEMPYSNRPQDAIQNNEDGNRIVVPPSYVTQFVIGQTVGIGLKRGKNQICAARTVVDLRPECGEIYIDGAPLPIRAGQFIYTQGWKCGCTDCVIAPSGSPISNSAQKYCCRYRGIENLWGNLYQWIDGCRIDGHEIFVSTDSKQYGNETDSSEKKLSYVLANENGYPTLMGSDDGVPWARLPVSVSAEMMPGRDFFYQSPQAATLRVGGHWGTPHASGLLSFAPCSPLDYCGTAITGRLAWRG